MRSGRVSKRIIPEDLIHHSRLVTRLINKIMRDGKKSLAQRLVYRAFEYIEKEQKESPLRVLEEAVANISPRMEVRPRRVGGASYMVPMEVRGDRRESLALQWLIGAAGARSNREYHTFDLKLAAELLEASKNQGGAVKKKEDVHRAAEANRAFAHFRW